MTFDSQMGEYFEEKSGFGAIGVWKVSSHGDFLLLPVSGYLASAGFPPLCRL